MPLPLEALEVRAETVAAGVPDPMRTMPIVDRLFAASVASSMGVSLISIPSGSQEWPITTSQITAGWQATELGNVAGPTAFTTAPRTLTPAHTYGV